MDGLVEELLEGARAEMAVVAEHGGAVKAVDYMKAALVDSHRERLRRIEHGEQIVVGLNKYEDTEPSPLLQGADGGILTVDPEVEAQQREAVAQWRASRDQHAVDAALADLAQVAAGDENIMPATIAAAKAGATTGEWSQTLREAFGEFRAPTGVGEAAAAASSDDELAAVREEVERVSEGLGRTLKILVGKPGLDGHSNGAEQIAVRARDAGMDVVYDGIRLTPSQIAASALQEGVHVVGLSILSRAGRAQPRREPQGARRGRRAPARDRAGSAGRRGARPHRRYHRPARRGQVDAAQRARAGLARRWPLGRRAGGRPVVAALGRR